MVYSLLGASQFGRSYTIYRQIYTRNLLKTERYKGVCGTGVGCVLATK